MKWILVFHYFSEEDMDLLCGAVALVLDFLLDATFFFNCVCFEYLNFKWQNVTVNLIFKKMLISPTSLLLLCLLKYNNFNKPVSIYPDVMLSVFDS